jgi:regulator of sigma E protease
MFQDGVMGSLDYRYPFVVDSLIPGGIAESLKIERGSKIISVAGYPIEYQTDLRYALNNRIDADVPFIMSLVENGTQRDVEVNMSEEQMKNGFGIMMRTTEDDIFKVTTREYSVGESIPAGISRGYLIMHDYIAQMKYIFTKKGAGQLGGFGTIAKLYPDTFDWVRFWGTTALISFILAIMNILPIPALDGGHVMFLLYEIVTGRKPGDKFMERAQITGILILLTLMVYANGNDIYRWLFT